MTGARGMIVGCAFAVASALPAAAQQPVPDAKAAEANRQLVIAFYERVFNRHEVAEGAELVADGYKQHNPNVPDGKAPFVAFFIGRFRDNPDARSRIVRSAVDGDLVWLHVHSTTGPGDRGRAIVDIFRVEGGRIVEHWDVVQPVPERSANPNTMF